MKKVFQSPANFLSRYLAQQIKEPPLKSSSKLLPKKESETTVLEPLSPLVKGNARKVYVKVPENIQA